MLTAAQLERRRLDVGLGLDDLLAAIVAARTDVVPPVHFARHRFDAEGRVGEKVVGAVHAALRCRFPVLLDSHLGLLLMGLAAPLFDRGKRRKWGHLACYGLHAA